MDFENNLKFNEKKKKKFLAGTVIDSYLFHYFNEKNYVVEDHYTYLHRLCPTSEKIKIEKMVKFRMFIMKK